MVFLMIFGFIFSLNFIVGAGIQADYKIIGEKVLVELKFDSISDLELRIPYDIEAFEINTGDYSVGEYSVEDFGNYKVFSVGSAQNLVIKYITETMVDKAKNKYFFISKNYFDGVVDVTLSLPEAFILSEQRLLFPEPDNISTDGRKIILTWNEYDDEQILVSYEFLEKGDLVFYIIIGVLIFIIIIFYFFQKKRFEKEVKKVKEKTKAKKKGKKKFEEITKNLFEDEKRIVEFLLKKKKKESWTKELVKGLGISKVKLSRKLKSLEKKEVIKKIPYGNENKIRLLK